MKCKNCKRIAELHSGVKNGQLYSDICERCVGVFGSASLAREYDRKFQRREYAKDILQPGETEFIKAYGADKAREHGWSEEDIRKYG